MPRESTEPPGDRCVNPGMRGPWCDPGVWPVGIRGACPGCGVGGATPGCGGPWCDPGVWGSVVRRRGVGVRGATPGCGVRGATPGCRGPWYDQVLHRVKANSSKCRKGKFVQYRIEKCYAVLPNY